MDFAAVLGSLLHGGTIPDPILLVVGTIVFPLICTVVLMDKLPGNPWLQGATWGAFWVLAEAAMMPAIGRGFFSAPLRGYIE